MKSGLLKFSNSRLFSLRPLWTQGLLTLVLFFLCLLFSNAKANTPNQQKLKQSITNQHLVIKSHESNLKQLESEQKRRAHKIRNLDRNMSVIEKKTAVLLTEAEQLNDEREELLSALKTQEDQLNELLRKSFMLGHNSSVKIILNNEDPGINDRYLAYTKYLAQKRYNLIQDISKQRKELQKKDEQLTVKKEELANLKTHYNDLKQTLINEKIEQQNTVKDLKDTIDKEKKQLEETAVALKQLENELSQKQKELTAKRKREAEQRQKAKLQAKASAKTRHTQSSSTHQTVAALGLQRLHGVLPWPVHGSVIHSFGERRSGEVTWKGLVISAPAGKTVVSIADGDCIYSGWLNGLGNIVVIDHGRGYLSLYGNNQKLKISSGNSVHKGDAIAVVGNSGNLKTNSLYFEIRYEGIPVDPKRWLGKR